MRSSLRHFAVALPFLVATTLIGCDAGVGVEIPAEAPSVQVMASVVVPATNVNLLLTNSSTADWGYNGCGSPQLQRREGDTWVDGPQPLIICTAELSILSAGSARTVAYAVPVGLAPATYRLSYRFIRGAGIEVLPVTNSFVVQ